MRFSLSSLARLAVGGLVVSSAAAIGLARFAPEPRGWRLPAPVRYASVNAFYLKTCQRGSVWADRDGGPSVEVPYRDDERLEYASLSPWRDERGRAHAAGRWSWGFQGDKPDMSFGLVRLGFPDGEVLDHVETDVVPVSAPCWYRGTRARVLFAAGDGKLYQYSFEAPDSGPATASSARAEERPRPLSWNCRVPGGGDVYLSDPTWPTAPEFDRLIFVVLRQTERVGGHFKSTRTRVWWLRLDEAGGSVEEAGPLFAPTGDVAEVDQRCPAVGQAPDGRAVLGYLRRGRSRTSDLYLAELQIDPVRGVPLPIDGPGTKLADGCCSTPPIFSTDGRWITAVEESGGGSAVVRRHRTDLGPGPVAGAIPPGRAEIP